MDISRSRLSSITQQSNEVEGSIKTSHALLLTYFELYAINYVELPGLPINVFQAISAQVEKQNPSLIANFHPFDQQESERQAQRQANFLRQMSKQQVQGNRILSRQQLADRIKIKLAQNQRRLEKQEQFVQTIAQSKKQPQVQDTADSTTSIPQILEKLKQFDEERTQIKFQIYAEDSSKIEHLYMKWSDLHRKMKEILQIYVSKIGNGKSLLEIYREINKFNHSKTLIEGFTERQLLAKLDTYIQSLFLDEREILLYRSSSEKSRTVFLSSAYAQNKNIRKKLNYT